MIPPKPHSKKNLFDPNSQESPVSAATAEAHDADESGPLNGELRAASNNELKTILSRFSCVLSAADDVKLCERDKCNEKLRKLSQQCDPATDFFYHWVTDKIKSRLECDRESIVSDVLLLLLII